MRRARPSAQMTASVVSLPAPVGGWNARDPVAAMPPNDAPILVNWWPEFDGVSLRRGSITHVGSTPLGGGTPTPVETLHTYVGSNGAETLFAWAGTSIYDVTGASATWGSAVRTSMGDAVWCATNMRTSAGSFLVACREASGTVPQVYNGSTWADIIVSGHTDTELCFVWNFKQRLFFLGVNSTVVKFLPVDSIGGLLATFNPGNLLKRGGFWVAGATWTIDAGYGLDDHLVLISSEGEVVVYTGTAPTNNDFRPVGVFDIGRPLSRRCFQKLGGDLVVMTADGAVPLSGALQSTRVRPDVAVSDKIRGAFKQAARLYAFGPRWSVHFWPEGSMLLLNIPSSPAEQYAMNTQTQGWTRLVGYAANCWAQLNGALYYGGAGAIVRAWTGTDDNGAQIEADCQQAYNYFGNRARIKRFTLARPIFRVAPPFGQDAIAVGINTDYSDTAPLYVPTYTGVASPSVWSVSGPPFWGTGVWPSDTIQARWQGVTGVGTAGALRLRLALANTRVTWQATDIVFEPGGVL